MTCGQLHGLALPRTDVEQNEDYLYEADQLCIAIPKMRAEDETVPRREEHQAGLAVLCALDPRTASAFFSAQGSDSAPMRGPQRAVNDTAIVPQ